MKAVVQRVKKAKVTVGEMVTGEISYGLLVYIGVDIDDVEKDITWIINKIIHLRIFSDSEEKLNLSIIDKGYDILVISQFTLLGNCKKGRRPSYDRAMKPDEAKNMYDRFIDKLRSSGIRIECGVFQEHMDVEYVNDGPITMIIDSKE